MYTYTHYIHTYTHTYIYIYTQDNTEKIWEHWFLTKPKMIAAGVWGVQGDALVKAWVRNPQTILFFFSDKTC